MITSNKQKGFTLLLAVLVSSIVLSVGLAIFSLTFKELRLSSAGRESQFAFYAADSGIECALYHDQRANAFSTTSPSSSITCNNTSLPVTSSTPIPGTYVRTFSLVLDSASNRYCSNVTVTKTDGDTAISARGTNTCGGADSRRVERAIEVTF